MARLVIKSQTSGDQVIELKLGTNRLGRSPENDFSIEHPTISATHCEVLVADGYLVVRDCGSTNGTFVRGQPVSEATLLVGDSFYLGAVPILVETTDFTIAIPKFDVPRPAPPVVFTDGAMACPRHPQARVTHQCPKCLEVMCDQCLHRLRRRGGKSYKLCPLCSAKVEPLGGETKKKKKSVLGFLRKTVKLPFLFPPDRVD